MHKLFVSVICVLVLVLASCSGSKKNDPAPDALHGTTWKVLSVTIDGQDNTPPYSNFRITFADDDNYSITGRPDKTPFLPYGSVAKDRNSISQNDGMFISLTIVSTSQIVLKFAYNGTGYTGGRIAGNWIVTLIKI